MKPSEEQIQAFYVSPEWRRIRYDALILYGCRCLACGAGVEQDAVLHVDHIKPLRTHWELRLEIDNLQVLCEDCNLGKGSRRCDDLRTEKAKRLAKMNPIDRMLFGRAKKRPF